jgi:hypothetical protein
MAWTAFQWYTSLSVNTEAEEDPTEERVSDHWISSTVLVELFSEALDRDEENVIEKIQELQASGDRYEDGESVYDILVERGIISQNANGYHFETNINNWPPGQALEIYDLLDQLIDSYDITWCGGRIPASRVADDYEYDGPQVEEATREDYRADIEKYLNCGFQE